MTHTYNFSFHQHFFFKNIFLLKFSPFLLFPYSAPDDFVVPPTVTLLATGGDFGESSDVIIDLPQEVVNNDQDFESFRINILDTFGTAPSNMFFRGTVVTIIDFGTFLSHSGNGHILGPAILSFIERLSSLRRLKCTSIIEKGPPNREDVLSSEVKMY